MFSSSKINRKKQRIGELLVEHGLINSNQLKEALKRQSQVGGHIGSVLVEMGFITLDTLLNFLYFNKTFKKRDITRSIKNKENKKN